MSRLPHGRRELESAHEEHEEQPPRGGGASARHEGGFAEGEHGRGPTPYSRKHSGKYAGGQSLEAHAATSGRGDGGSIGKADSHKGHSEDIEHPMSHSDFECLGGE
jgi:hypothetical protein